MSQFIIDNVVEVIERIPKPSGGSIIITVPKHYNGRAVKVVLVKTEKELDDIIKPF